MVVHNTRLRPTFVRGDTKTYITLTEHQYIYFEIKDVQTGKYINMTTLTLVWKAFRDTIEFMVEHLEDVNYETCAN